MWGWKPAKRALEHLFAAGEVAIAGRQGFQRLYDLAERVIPRGRARGAGRRARRSSGAGFALRAVAGPRRADRGRDRRALPPSRRGARDPAARRRARRGGARAPGRARRRRRAGRRRRRGGARRRAERAPCSSAPSTTWSGTARFLRRLFGFDHLIEVYKRPHERVYGYYVLPLLVGDRLVGRADLKADRARGVLQIRRFTPEPGVRRSLDEPLERAAARLARSLGLEGVER